MKISKLFKNGILNENPILVQLVGICSVLAVSTNAINSLAMSMAVIVVLLGSNISISLCRNIIPKQVRIPVFIVVIATFVTIVDMFLNAYLPDIYASLGIFIPLIVVNCLILARAESFAYSNGVLISALDGLAMGLGYTVAITVLGSIREIIGNGTIFGIELFGPNFQAAKIFTSPAGSFIVLGILVGLFNIILKKTKATA